MIGLSDHTNNIFTSIAASSLEVCAIEKHFNIDNKKTPDSTFSIKPKMLSSLKEISVKIFKSFNKKDKKKYIKKNIRFRRSIFAKKIISKGERITLKNTKSLRPLIGIGSDKIFKIIGRKVNKNIPKDAPLFFKDLNLR